ncbi:MAG: HAMP domain-containing sensor histidine kinase [Anaerocolumna sp.]
MKKRFYFRSIYAKFAICFLSIWWLLNTLTFFAVIRILYNNHLLDKLKNELDYMKVEYMEEVQRLRLLMGFTFLMSELVGTVLILFTVRYIVKPIKGLSEASREVAKGNFDVTISNNSMDEIGQLTADFNLMTKELKNIDILRKDFVSNVSHEYKTPITSILGYAKLIADNSLTEEQLKEYSGIIVNESERLAVLSTNLLRLSELDSKAIRDQSVLYSLDEQIRKIILLLEIQWSKKSMVFDIELEAIMFNGDKNLLSQVWLNLIQNAIKFSNQNGIIAIRLYKNQDAVIFHIKNQGIGISEEDKPHIFERFYKGDKSRSKEGNGLGLVLVKKIIDLSDGTIFFDSIPDKGTTFVVELPIIPRENGIKKEK